jgi:hypothetical protein
MEKFQPVDTNSLEINNIFFLFAATFFLVSAYSEFSMFMSNVGSTPNEKSVGLRVSVADPGEKISTNNNIVIGLVRVRKIRFRPTKNMLLFHLRPKRFRLE